MKKLLDALYRLLLAAVTRPVAFAQALYAVPSLCSAYVFSQKYDQVPPASASGETPPVNPLMHYFQNHKKGRGIWKWEHYFDVYHRHLARFVGRKVNILEIGIYSGGSLDMWRSYFGVDSHVYGVDIEAACKAYASDHVTVFVGDQADRGFWRGFRDSVEGIDILIDDGGHTPEQQQTTLEEMLPYLRPGGVYVCEDVHGCRNRFAAFASGLVAQLNDFRFIPGPVAESHVSAFQSAIHSIHFYPYLLVVEKHSTPLEKLTAPKHGTEWQPFL